MMIRRADQTDAAALAAIDAVSNAEAWSADAFAEGILVPSRLILAAEEDGTVCGFLAGEIQGDLFAIDEIAVHPEMRRRGIARNLLARSLADSKASGCVEVSLEVRSRNTGAIAFYETMGFARAGVRKRLYRDPDDDGIVMIRSTI